MNNRTAPIIANKIMMARTQDVRAVIILEGTTDLRVYSKFFNESKCKCIPMHNKEKTIAVLNILLANHFEGVLTIIDKDFNSLNGVVIDNNNILLTDTHDLESMIIFSSALENLIFEFGSDAIINQFSESIRKKLLRTGLPIGYCRWLSSQEKDNLNLNFKNLHFLDFLNFQLFSIDIDRFIDKLIANSCAPTIPEGYDLKGKIIQLLTDETHNPWDVCVGHDLVAILSEGLINKFGHTRRGRHLNYEIIDGMLRLSFDCSHFRQTELYRKIATWEENNPNFNVLVKCATP